MGTTLSNAVIHALEQQIRKTPQPISRERIGELCSRIAGCQVLYARAPDQILGYDEFDVCGWMQLSFVLPSTEHLQKQNPEPQSKHRTE
jgi:hypothetical protein